MKIKKYGIVLRILFGFIKFKIKKFYNFTIKRPTTEEDFNKKKTALLIDIVSQLALIEEFKNESGDSKNEKDK